MQCKTVCLLMMLAMLTACTPRTAADTGGMPDGKWDFVFFTPHALPATVTRAMIIDTGNLVSAYRTLDGTPGDPDTINTWHNHVRSHSHFNKASHPPAAMLFCWDSIIDKKTYETRIVFEPSLRDIMLTPTGKDRYGDTAWYDTLLFGLAPEGKVRIWLQTSASGENVPLIPKKITTLSGDKLDVCKDFPARIDFNYVIPDGYDQYVKDFIKGKTYPYGNW